MDRLDDEVIELGTITGETMGLPMGTNDTLGGHKSPGLTDD